MTTTEPLKPNLKVETLRVGEAETDMRLDRWFRVHFPEVGYTYPGAHRLQACPGQ
jgi:hypothetical protein